MRRGRMIAMASVLAVTPMITGIPQLSSAPQPHPVKSQTRQVGFVKSSVASLRSARNATKTALSTAKSPDPVTTARSAAVTPVQNVAGAVTVVGVTWPKGAVTTKDEFQIRTRSGTTWSQWQTLDADQADGPDAKEAATAFRGTSPFVVTGASGYEVRTLTTDSSAPTAAKVQAVDPGTSGADSARPAPGAAAAAAARPAIHSRAAWGANERLRRSAPSYGKVSVGFVHHTVSANSYSASSVPAMIRGIYAYHVQSLGWSDIGYNFLVDRFGRIWEGRYGGVTRAVVGAQTSNYNSVSFGVSAIGNFDVTGAPTAMTNAFKRIFAWKLSLARLRATGTVVLRGRSLQRISGHRNAFPTACPGRYLYAKLPTIRSGAAALIAGRATAPAPKPKPPAASTAWRTTRYTPHKRAVLRQGSRGRAVVILQKGLRLNRDGVFGPRTRAALVTFQRQQRLARTGVTTRVLWDRIERRDHPLIAYRWKNVVLRQGSRGAAVKVMQRAVRVGADGVFGARTKTAVKSVQRRAKMAQTGVVSGWTWVAIENRMPR